MAEVLHPSQETLRRFARVEASRRENREVVAHLLRGCRACSASILSFLESGPEEGEVLGLAASGTPSSASPLFAPLDFRLRDG